MILTANRFIILTLIVLASAALFVAPPLTVLITIACLLVFTLPGWLMPRIWGAEDKDNPFLWVAQSFIMGYFISTIIAVIILMIIGKNHYLVLLLSHHVCPQLHPSKR